MHQEGIATTKLTPFIKWAGGKRWLVSNHPEIFPKSFGRYVEPFLGSGAVFFHLKPPNAILTDVNEELINAYRIVRSKRLQLAAALVDHQQNHSDEYYYAIRTSSPAGSVDRAARFLYLNRTCWNGLYRVNRRGEFNVPRGTKNEVVLSSDNFASLAKVLKGVSLAVADFEYAIDQAERGDLLFVDPPYTVKHNLNGFVKYNDQIFSWTDQIRLRDALTRASKRRVKIVMTNANHRSVRALYAGFKQSALRRHSILSGSAHARGETEELLVKNF